MLDLCYIPSGLGTALVLLGSLGVGFQTVVTSVRYMRRTKPIPLPAPQPRVLLSSGLRCLFFVLMPRTAGLSTERS